MRPLRITHVVRRFDPLVGGTERYVGDLARAQARAGYDVTVVTLDRDVNGIFKGRFPSWEVTRGVQVIRLPGVGSSRFGITLRPDRLLRFAARSDVVHLHDLRFMLGFVSVARRLLRRPTFVHTHGLIFGTPAFWRLKRILTRIYYQPLLKITKAHIVASSQSDRDRLGTFMPALLPHASIILSAVDLGPFFAVDRSPTPGRIAFVGRVTALKGIERLLRALPLVQSSWSLTVHGAGEGDEPARLLDLARELGISDRIEFTGPFVSKDEPGFLSTAALAVFPSTSEGMPGALIDAMAVGVPVLASSISAHRELLAPVDLELLVDFDRPGEVAAAIDQRFRGSTMDQVELARRLRGRASEFDVERLRRDIDELYRKLGIRPRH